MAQEEIVKPLEIGETQEKAQETLVVKRKINWKLILSGLLIVVLGVASGWGLSRLNKKVGQGGEGEIKASEIKREVAKGEEIKIGQVYGLPDVSFKDKAEGVVDKNGVKGEGTHKLIREGGESQTAYLTSSVLDLDLFVGRKVEIWGETYAGQTAGWLLDVGRIKVLE